MTRWLLVLFLGCAHADPCRDATVCDPAIPAAAMNDPAELRAIVVDARTREQPPDCFSCEEGSACAMCERLVDLALYRLAEIGTPEAAEQAAALVLDSSLGWDGGPALILGHALTRMGPVIVPFLQPHRAASRLADRILGCIERGEPCI